MMKIEGSRSGSGSISQINGFPDPDPHQNVMDPQHCFSNNLSLWYMNFEFLLEKLSPFPRLKIWDLNYVQC
jgi:hypothetical protein